MPRQFDAEAPLKAKVKKLYEAKKIGSVEAGEMLGCTPITAIRLMRREGVEIRGRGRPKKVEKK